MKKFLSDPFNFAISVITVACVVAALAFILPARAGSAESLNRGQRIELLTSTTGELLYAGEKICSLSKIGPSTFLTARHCVKDFDVASLSIRYKKDDADLFPATRDVMWVTQGRKHDLAIVKTDTDIEGMSSLGVACQEDVKMGQDVAAMGFPAPMGRYYTEGYVNSVGKTDIDEFTNTNFWMDLRAAPGSSGGPIIDANTGKQIGVLIEIIVPDRVGNIATGAEGISVSALCPVPDIPEEDSVESKLLVHAYWP